MVVYTYFYGPKNRIVVNNAKLAACAGTFSRKLKLLFLNAKFGEEYVELSFSDELRTLETELWTSIVTAFNLLA